LVETSQTAGRSVKVCGASDLTVSKTATPTFGRTFNWTISKSVDKTTVDQVGGSVKFTYTVKASETGYADSGQLTGSIKVTNPNNWEAFTGVNVTDLPSIGGNCAVTNGTNVTVPASSSVTLSYTCTYTSVPTVASGTNTATASWSASGFYTADGSASGQSASFSVSPALVNPSVT